MGCDCAHFLNIGGAYFSLRITQNVSEHTLKQALLCINTYVCSIFVDRRPRSTTSATRNLAHSCPSWISPLCRSCTSHHSPCTTRTARPLLVIIHSVDPGALIDIDDYIWSTPEHDGGRGSGGIKEYATDSIEGWSYTVCMFVYKLKLYCPWHAVLLISVHIITYIILLCLGYTWTRVAFGTNDYARYDDDGTIVQYTIVCSLRCTPIDIYKMSNNTRTVHCSSRYNV